MVLAAEMDRMGIVTADELGIDSLAKRTLQEMKANQSVIVGRGEIGAWTRLLG